MKTLLRKLVQADSTCEKGELIAAKVVAAELEGSGIDVHVDCWDSTRANVTARLKSAQAKRALLFGCHLDVVPPGQETWSNPPFSGLQSQGRIYGRGATDMKGGLTAIVCAMRELADSHVRLKGDVILAATAGEETDSCGASRFVSQYAGKLPELAGVVLPEPTDFDVVTAHRGLLWLEIAAKGKAAHGSTPHLGINAITSMLALLEKLQSYKIKCVPHKLLGECSMSVNTITGGQAINVVPDSCKIGIDIRTLPGQNNHDIINDFQAMFEQLKAQNPQFDAQVSVVRMCQAMETDSNCDFVKDLCSAVGIGQTKAVGFTTDGPHFACLGAPIVVFGPGKPHLCHKPNEYIDISDVEKAVDCYKRIIMKVLA
jgi:succinyl-diaminopimelate desuccinylase